MPLLGSGIPGGSDSEESVYKAGNLGSILGSGSSSKEGNGYPLRCSCLENPMDRGAWQGTVHGAPKESHMTEGQTLFRFCPFPPEIYYRPLKASHGHTTVNPLTVLEAHTWVMLKVRAQSWGRGCNHWSCYGNWGADVEVWGPHGNKSVTMGTLKGNSWFP